MAHHHRKARHHKHRKGGKHKRSAAQIAAFKKMLAARKEKLGSSHF